MNSPLYPPLVNLFLATTNIAFGLPCYWVCNLQIEIMLVSFVIASSFLMHISETKHYLLGYSNFGRYSFWFLQLDRFAAFMCFGYLFSLWFSLELIIPWLELIVGIICLIISELSDRIALKIEMSYNPNINSTYTNVHDTTRKIHFSFHAMWHFCAFRILYLLFDQRIRLL